MQGFVTPVIQFVLAGSWLFLAALCLFYIAASVILNYHWGKYGIRARRLQAIRFIYFGVSSVLFLLLAILMYSFTL